MRPRILYDLSQRLAVLLEEGLRGTRGTPRIPVLICHPLDPLEAGENIASGSVGVLYPSRIVPEARWRQAGLTQDSPHRGERLAPLDLKETLRFPSLWVRVRYIFLVTGGTIEDQLSAIAAALRALHDHPTVILGPEGTSGPGGAPESSGAPGSMGAAQGAGGPSVSGPRSGEEDEALRDLEAGTFPLRLLEDVEGWRELGLREHALTIAFEVTVPIPSARTETLSRVLERRVDLEEGPQ